MMDLDGHLERTSRTFALAIPRLPEPTRRAVTVAYLLFRVADTLEDAAVWPRAQRVAALDAMLDLLRDPDLRAHGAVPAGAEHAARRWADAAPSENAGYVALLRETPALLAETQAFSPRTRAAVLHHAARTAEGMRGFVRRADDAGTLTLGSLQDLKDYCYVVAGIVGELLTDLFTEHADLRPAEPALRENAIAFGEGLQLVNILKDAADDAAEGRTFLPAGVARADVLALAREDLARAARYVDALRDAHAPRGFVEFTDLPMRLARAGAQIAAQVNEVASAARHRRQLGRWARE
jgi:farnesyl-diphosphate farnesyltransferase